MDHHLFLFSPGTWLGEGTVSFSVSPDKVQFYTKWEVEAIDSEKKIRCAQTVEMRGVEEKVVNYYTLSSITQDSFNILLRNDLLEEVVGKGFVDNGKIAWEFRGTEAFEGFEIFEAKEDNQYLMHAEFASPDNFRTIIDGKIWYTK